MSLPVEYANLHSRLFLKSHYERHFVIPLERPPRALEALLRWYERFLLRVDTRTIKIDRPIFLVGVPRSGTTMLQDILCCHPQVAYITNTMHQFRRCFCAAEDLRKRLRLDFRGMRYLADGVQIRPGTANEGQAFLAEWRHVDPYSLAYVEVNPHDITEEDAIRLTETIRKIMSCFAGEEMRFLNKNPSFLPYLSVLQALFPDVKIVHIVRDPRMCAPSLIKLYRRTREQESRIRAALHTRASPDSPFIPYPRLPRLAEYIQRYGPDDIQTTARLWNDAISLLNQQRTGLYSFYEVRFEDILADPIGELNKICEFCELPRVSGEDAPFWQAVGQVDPHRQGTPDNTACVIENICRDNMELYGYC